MGSLFSSVLSHQCSLKALFIWLGCSHGESVALTFPSRRFVVWGLSSCKKELVKSSFNKCWILKCNTVLLVLLLLWKGPAISEDKVCFHLTKLLLFCLSEVRQHFSSVCSYFVSVFIGGFFVVCFFFPLPHAVCVAELGRISLSSLYLSGCSNWTYFHWILM